VAQRRPQPCGASRRRAECIHGAAAEPAPVEQAAHDQLLQHILHDRPVEAEPEGATGVPIAAEEPHGVAVGTPVADVGFVCSAMETPPCRPGLALRGATYTCSIDGRKRTSGAGAGSASWAGMCAH